MKNKDFSTVLFGAEGETRTLAPVTRPTPLAGAPRHQLEYFCKCNVFKIYSIIKNGGEEGIRTLETLLTPTRFPIVRLRPAQPPLHRGFANPVLYYNSSPGFCQGIFHFRPGAEKNSLQLLSSPGWSAILFSQNVQQIGRNERSYE